MGSRRLAVLLALSACAPGPSATSGALSAQSAAKYVTFRDEAYGLRVQSARLLHKAPSQTQEVATPAGVPVTISGYAATNTENETLTAVNVQVVETRGGIPVPEDLTCKKSLTRFLADMAGQIACKMPAVAPSAMEHAPGVMSLMGDLTSCTDKNLRPTARVLCDDRARGRVVFVALLGQAKDASDDLLHFLCSPEIGGMPVPCRR